MSSFTDDELKILGISQPGAAKSARFPASQEMAQNSAFSLRDSSKVKSQSASLSPKGSNTTTILDDSGISGDSSVADKYNIPDNESKITDFTESTLVPRRSLGFLQTTSLMLNGCFAGYAFFLTPYYTLALVRSKRICFVLWVVGTIYSALGMTIFLEYGTALPYTGGALIYLNRVFRYPKMLATVMFSFYWIFIYTTEAACKSIAQTILSLSTGRSPLDLEVRLINFTAIVVQTTVCLLLFFARRATFAFNTVFAAYRISLMIVILVAGLVVSRRGLKDFNVEYPGYNGKDTLSAMTNIILVCQGYENANFVTGEIKNAKRTLKWSGIAAISITNVFYLLVILAFFAVDDFATLTTPQGQASTADLFASIVFGHGDGLRAAVLLCAIGTLIFATYTASRVKQAIAWQRIIPFWQLFGRQDPHYDSPGGGLFLHWIVTCIGIICVGNTASDSRMFLSGMYAYGYQITFVFLGLGLFRLKTSMRQYEEDWQPTYLKKQAVLVFVATIFIAMNIVILATTALPRPSGKVPRFYWPVSMAALVAAALVYWVVLRQLQTNRKHRHTLASKVGLHVYVYEEDDKDIPDEMRFPMYEAFMDGGGRRVEYRTSGFLKRCSSSLHKFKNNILRLLDW